MYPFWFKLANVLILWTFVFPSISIASTASCQSAQLKAVATLCKKAFSCESTYTKKPGKDPQTTKRDSCILKTKDKFVSSWDKVLAKEAKKGVQCTLSDSGNTLVAGEILDIETLLSDFKTGWDSSDTASNSLYSGLLSAAGTHCTSALTAHATNAAKANADKLASALLKAQNKFIASANAKINKATAKGFSYSGLESSAIATSMLSFVDAVVTETGGVNAGGNNGGSTSIKAVSASLGNEHSCFLLSNQKVKCFGYSIGGRLGLGFIFDLFTDDDSLGVGDHPKETANTVPYVNLGTGRTAKAIGSGYAHTCALLDNNDVKCWGSNLSGELGLGSFGDIGFNNNEMGDNLPSLDFGVNQKAIQLSVGGDHNCVQLDNNSLKCWGNNLWGELGNGSDNQSVGSQPGQMGDALKATDLGTGRTAMQVALSQAAPDSAHSCARLDDGSVKCWGSDDHGRLGIGLFDPHEFIGNIGDEPGQMGDNLPAVNLGVGRSSVQLAAGALHNCSILDNNQLKCWGANESGQLGLGDTQDRGTDVVSEMGDNLPAVNLGVDRYAVEIALGITHSCARLDNGTVKCWGANSFGQLGLGDTKFRGRLSTEMGDNLPTVNLGAGRTAKRIFAGGNHSCALLDNDAMKCWGANTNGQLALGDSENRGDQANEMGGSLPAIDFGNK